VAFAARSRGEAIGIIASGERWGDGSMRPAYEDLIGAGAIMDSLPAGSWSPEARATRSAFVAARDHLEEHLMDCASARELVALGYVRDVQIASELNVSGTVPILHSGAYTARAWPEQ
jgi:2-phosphosulfolactate phosphatase